MFEKLDDKMFQNSGRKIKTISRVIAWIGIFGNFVSGLVLFIMGVLFIDTMGYMLILAPILVGLGILSSWLAVIFNYAFGDLVDSSQLMHRQLIQLTDAVLDIAKMLPVSATPTAQAESGSGSPVPSAPVAQEQNSAIASLPLKRNPQEESARKQEPTEKTLAQQLSYALQYSTNSGMCNYLAGIDNDRVRNILLLPPSLIREEVEKYLQELL